MSSCLLYLQALEVVPSLHCNVCFATSSPENIHVMVKSHPSFQFPYNIHLLAVFFLKSPQPYLGTVWAALITLL